VLAMPLRSRSPPGRESSWKKWSDGMPPIRSHRSHCSNEIPRVLYISSPGKTAWSITGMTSLPRTQRPRLSTNISIMFADAQAGILLPFTHRALRSLISRYQHVLAKKVSPSHPYQRKINDRIITITDIWKLEFYDFKELTKNPLSSQETSLRGRVGLNTDKVLCKMESVAELIRLFVFPYQLANWQGFRST
jgi:hypothetical protein